MVYKNTDYQADFAMEQHHYGIYEPKLYGVCDGCGDEIYYGEPYYQMGRYRFCNQCIEESELQVAGEIKQIWLKK